MTSSLSSVELITACWAQKVPKVGFGLESRNPENEELWGWWWDFISAYGIIPY